MRKEKDVWILFLDNKKHWWIASGFSKEVLLYSFFYRAQLPVPID